MKRFKFTKLPTRIGVSTLMMLVACSAAVTYACMKASELDKVRTRYLAKANVHAAVHKQYSKQLKKQSDSELSACLAEHVRYHRDLEKKYSKAALTPWRIVEPDPPRPSYLPTDEQIAEAVKSSVKSMTPEEIHEKFREVQLQLHEHGFRPSYLPRKLSDLKSL